MTLNTQDADQLFIDKCCGIIKGVVGKYGWTLMSMTELTEHIVERNNEEPLGTEKAIRAAVLNIYSQELYKAMGMSVNKPEAQERCSRAIEDISHYLYAAALYRWQSPDLAQELMQDALVRIWEQRAKCKNPGAFLKFCSYRLMHAWTEIKRQHEAEKSYDDLFNSNEDDENSIRELVETKVLRPDVSLACRELWIAWLNRFAELSQTRAERQLDTIYCKYFLDLTDQEIAERLDTNVKNIHVMRKRGMDRLKNDTDLLEITGHLLEVCF